MDSQPKPAPAEPPKEAPAMQLPPPPEPEPVTATGALDSNGVPAPVPMSDSGGSVIAAGSHPSVKAKGVSGGFIATVKPVILPVAVAVVLFLALCAVAVLAYSQTK